MADQTFNIYIIGNAGVGKKSLQQRFASNVFESMPTRVPVQVRITVNKKSVLLNIYPTNQDALDWRRTQQRVDGVIVLYDITDVKSWEAVPNWLQLTANPNTVQIVVGTKQDLEEKRQVSTKVVDAFAYRSGLFMHQVSSKTGKNVEDMFLTLIRMLQERDGKLKRTAPVVADPEVEVKDKVTDSVQRSDEKLNAHPLCNALDAASLLLRKVCSAKRGGIPADKLKLLLLPLMNEILHQLE